MALAETDDYSDNSQLEWRRGLSKWSAFDVGGRGGARRTLYNFTDCFMFSDG